ncbi:hypothetical protein JOE33_001049 [Pseudomonas sp. PvP027]|nr:hypothetical protein [Pseudomonas sp. PvP027]
MGYLPDTQAYTHPASLWKCENFVNYLFAVSFSDRNNLSH